MSTVHRQVYTDCKGTSLRRCIYRNPDDLCISSVVKYVHDNKGPKITVDSRESDAGVDDQFLPLRTRGPRMVTRSLSDVFVDSHD